MIVRVVITNGVIAGKNIIMGLNLPGKKQNNMLLSRVMLLKNLNPGGKNQILLVNPNPPEEKHTSEVLAQGAGPEHPDLKLQREHPDPKLQGENNIIPTTNKLKLLGGIRSNKLSTI